MKIEVSKYSKTYKTIENLENAVNKINSENLRYVVVIAPDGRFSPVFLNANSLCLTNFLISKCFTVVG